MHAVGLASGIKPAREGGRLFGTSTGFFFYENGHNSVTKSQKLAPKGGNERSLRGLQTGR